MTKEERQRQLAKERVRKWAVDPLLWVKDLFGDNIYKAQLLRGVTPKTESGLSLQQEDALRRWGKLLEAKILKMEGKELTEEQQVLAGKMGLSIMSANGTGKDFIAALLNWHFMSVFSAPHVMATANTGKQLKSVFWSELSRVRALAKETGKDSPSELITEFTIQNDKVFKSRLPDRYGKDAVGKTWITEAVTINAKATPDEQGEALAGRHARFMLIIIDEASGIPDAVFRPLERTLTDNVNLCFMIFNPTRNTGYAIDSHGKNKELWDCLHWSALDSENVTQEQIERLLKYGKDSPAYRIGVLGLPPISDSNALIPYEWITEAIGRELAVVPFDPVVFGCDVGGGGDRSVIAIRQSGTVQDLLTDNQKDTMEVANWIASHFWREDASVAYVDIIGLGRGVYDRLNQLGVVARPADARGKAKAERFFNSRAEMYFKLREQFENKCISIPDDRELIDELGAIKTETVSNKSKILDKKEIRKTLGFSPDKADALAMTYHGNDDAYRKGAHKPNKIDYSKFKSGVI